MNRTRLSLGEGSPYSISWSPLSLGLAARVHLNDENYELFLGLFAVSRAVHWARREQLLTHAK